MKTDSPLPKSNRVSGCVQRLVRLVDWLRSSPGPSGVDVWTARQWADDIESELNLPSCLLDVDAICEQRDQARASANEWAAECGRLQAEIRKLKQSLPNADVMARGDNATPTTQKPQKTP